MVDMVYLLPAGIMAGSFLYAKTFSCIINNFFQLY